MSYLLNITRRHFRFIYIKKCNNYKVYVITIKENKKNNTISIINEMHKRSIYTANIVYKYIMNPKMFSKSL